MTTQNNFDTAIARVLGNEGGYVNNPHDPGGETNWGVTIVVARASGYTGSMRVMTRDQAVAIYKAAYWDKVKGDSLPLAVAYQVFDAAVNHGVYQASKFLQAALGVVQDGNLGPITIAAANAQSPLTIATRFNQSRIMFYAALATFDTFGRGWVRRVAGNLGYAAVDAKTS
jgi:lysozyme family protein